MSLDAVRQREFDSNFLPDADSVFAKWQDSPVSEISHHGAACCETAREWLTAMDFSLLNNSDVRTGPRWIRARYQWGVSGWSIHWCEAIKRKTLDCGALAALAGEVFRSRGAKSHRVQMVQRFSIEATTHWARQWTGENVSTYWINDDVIYHEGNAVVTRGNEIKIWDASAGWWVNPLQADGYGSLLAVKITAVTADVPQSFAWGAHKIVPNRWQKL